MNRFATGNRWGAAPLAALALALAAPLAGCESPPAERRFAGALPGCGGPATLTRQGDRFAFAPGDGALVLRGPVAADGGFAAELNTQPPGKPAYPLRVSGVVSEESARVAYATPRCRAEATLPRRD